MRSTRLVRWYQRGDRFSHGLRKHLMPWGRWLLIGAIAAGAFGINTRVGASYQLFILLVCVLLTAWIASRFGKLPVVATRQLPRYATVGERVHYRLQLHNQGANAQHDLTVFDELQASPAPIWPSRWVTYRQWRRLITHARGATSTQQSLPTLPPRASTETTLTLTPLRRGWLTFTVVHIGRPDPLGLIQRIFLQPQPDRLLVLPRRYPVTPLNFQTGRRYQRGGVHLAQSIGEEDEFIGLRDYRPGDPSRRIHWRSFAKRGEPVVKEFQDEFFVRYGLLLDNFSDTGNSERFEIAVSAAASIAAAERNPEALLDLLFVGDQAYCFTAGRGVGQTEQLLEILACVTTRPSSTISALHALLAGHAPALSACVCIFLDWDTERAQLLNVLRSHGVETVVLVVGPTTQLPTPTVQVVTKETLPMVLAALFDR